MAGLINHILSSLNCNWSSTLAGSKAVTKVVLFLLFASVISYKQTSFWLFHVFSNHLHHKTRFQSDLTHSRVVCLFFVACTLPNFVILFQNLRFVLKPTLEKWASKKPTQGVLRSQTICASKEPTKPSVCVWMRLYFLDLTWFGYDQSSLSNINNQNDGDASCCRYGQATRVSGSMAKPAASAINSYQNMENGQIANELRMKIIDVLYPTVWMIHWYNIYFLHFYHLYLTIQPTSNRMFNDYGGMSKTSSNSTATAMKVNPCDHNHIYDRLSS